MSFRDRQRCRIALIVTLFALLAVFYIFGLLETWFGIAIMSVLSVGVIVAILIIWRCPYCERLLPIRWLEPKFCPNCGAQLDDEDDYRPRK